MPEIRLADPSGFCFGVKRAVDGVYEKLSSGRPIYTYGPIVHNETVVSDLENKGVKVIEDRESLISTQFEPDACIIIRAHGIGRDVYAILEEKGCEVDDFTCPFVKRIHKIVEEGSRNGNQVFIAGNPGHPEVEGIRGWCHGDAIVVETVEETQKLTIDDKKQGILVAQTTFNFNKFDNLVEIFQQKGYNGTVVNTICNATEERQRAARELAKRADVMIVIGGKHSSNTRKLYDICSSECANTYYIQTLDDLSLVLPTTVRLVGITAGASTPNKLIEEVQNYVRINF